MKITIKEVAKEAGVSVATVSRVLNKSNAVSQAATDIVNEVIKKLNYSPNFLGRNLRKCETNTILAIIPTTEQSYYGEIIRGMQDSAKKLGYDVLLSISNGNVDTEVRLLEMLSKRTVDAAVLLSTHLDADTINSISEKHPIALCCERADGAEVLTVTIDDEDGAYAAVSKLIQKGHTKIGMISATNRAHSSIDRENGYFRALKDNGIALSEEYLYLNTYDYTNGGYAFDYFMGLKEPPTAIFAISDLLAVGAIKQALKRSMTPGKDIDIIGFDNISLCEMYVPSVSTVAQPCYEMGKTVIEKLVENITSPTKTTERIIMPYKLTLRQSTGD